MSRFLHEKIGRVRTYKREKKTKILPIKHYDFCTEKYDKNGDSDGRQNISLPQFTHSQSLKLPKALIESEENIE